MQLNRSRTRHLISIGAIAVAVTACGDDSAAKSGQGGAGEGGSTSASGGGEASGGAPSTSETSSTGGSTLPENQWTTIPFPTSADVFAVWAEAPDKVWVGADDGLYRSRDGMTFEKVDLGMPASIRDVNVDIYQAPDGRAAGATGESRLVLNYNPTTETWSPITWSASYTLPQAGSPIGRISSCGDAFWITSIDGSIAGYFDPTAILGQPNLYDAKAGDIVGYSARVTGIAGLYGNRAYAGTSRGIMRYGGLDDWTRQTEDITMADFYVDGATFDVWAVGTGIYRYDGEEALTWSSLSGGTWSSIQAIGAELWVAGAGSLARSTDRTSFTTLDIAPGTQLNDVSGASIDDVWAVGPAGTVWRCVGDACGEPSSIP